MNWYASHMLGSDEQLEHVKLHMDELRETWRQANPARVAARVPTARRDVVTRVRVAAGGAIARLGRAMAGGDAQDPATAGRTH